MTAADWIEGYKKAWASNARDDVSALFTPDASYRFAPNDEPRRGIDAIFAEWVDDAAFTFEYEVLSDDGALAFVQGVTSYPAPRNEQYDNLWVIRFAPDGRATEFTEWYIKRKAT